jgi:hypothetical protein
MPTGVLIATDGNAAVTLSKHEHETLQACLEAIRNRSTNDQGFQSVEAWMLDRIKFNGKSKRGPQKAGDIANGLNSYLIDNDRDFPGESVGYVSVGRELLPLVSEKDSEAVTGLVHLLQHEGWFAGWISTQLIRYCHSIKEPGNATVPTPFEAMREIAEDLEMFEATVDEVRTFIANHPLAIAEDVKAAHKRLSEKKPAKVG